MQQTSLRPDTASIAGLLRGEITGLTPAQIGTLMADFHASFGESQAKESEELSKLAEVYLKLPGDSSRSGLDSILATHMLLFLGERNKLTNRELLIQVFFKSVAGGKQAANLFKEVEQAYMRRETELKSGSAAGASSSSASSASSSSAARAAQIASDAALAASASASQTRASLQKSRESRVRFNSVVGAIAPDIIGPREVEVQSAGGSGGGGGGPVVEQRELFGYGPRDKNIRRLSPETSELLQSVVPKASLPKTGEERISRTLERLAEERLPENQVEQSEALRLAQQYSILIGIKKLLSAEDDPTLEPEVLRQFRSRVSRGREAGGLRSGELTLLNRIQQYARQFAKVFEDISTTPLQLFENPTLKQYLLCLINIELASTESMLR